MAELESGAKLYVAPANPAGRALAGSLARDGYQVLGFVDNFKKAEGIINNAGSAKTYDYLVVADGYHQNDICEGLIARGFDRKTLKLEVGGKNYFKEYRRNALKAIASILGHTLRNTLITVIGSIPRKHTVYYAEGFIDTNVLLAWRAHANRYPNEAVLVAIGIDPAYDDRILSERGALINRSWKGLWCLIRAKAIVIDHEYSGEWFTAIRKKRPVVQLWHGLPYKALSGNSHYPGIMDQAFISSSAWFNEHVFRNIFRAREYLALGYPRCDVFSQTPEEREWLGSVGASELERLKREFSGFWVYMPTYRDSGNDSWPLNLTAFSEFCRENDRAMLIKAHPFLEKKMREIFSINIDSKVLALDELTNIFIYPSHLNIYPFLADAEALITDYSSVSFDFKDTGKPVIYFQYDKDEYSRIRGECLVGDDQYAYGPIVKTHNELQAKLKQVVLRGNSLEGDTGIKKVEGTTYSESIVNYIRAL